MTPRKVQNLTQKEFLKLAKKYENSDRTVYRALVYERCKTDFGLFCSMFFDRDERKILSPFIRAHKDFFDWHLLNHRNRRGLFLWPRGFGKSTIMTRIATVYDIVYEREKYILLFSNTAEQSHEKARSIRSDFSDNDLLREIYGDLEGEPWRENLMKFRNGCMLRATSAQSSTRGFIFQNVRPTKTILDDIENSDDVLSPSIRQKQKDWYNEVVEFLGSSDEQTAMNIVVIGTVLHPDCLLADLQKRNDFDVFKEQAMISFPTNTELWADWQVQNSDLDNDNRIEDSKKFYLDNQAAMDEGSETLWPQNVKPGFPSKVYELMFIRLTLGEGAFNKELQNEPIDPERIVFNMAEADYFDIKSINGVQCVVRDDGTKIPLSALTIYGCLDPAGAPKRTAKTDYGTIVYVGRDRYARMYVLAAWLKRCPTSTQITQAFEMSEIWKPISFLVKETGTQGALYDAFRRETLERKRKGLWASLRCGWVHESENKINRITNMEPHITNNWLTFNRKLPHEFFDQFNQFPTHAHDDAPDAVHEVWDVLKHGAL